MYVPKWSQKFANWFAEKGLNVHDPRFGSWVDKASHTKWSYKYNKYWQEYISNHPNASAKQIIEYAKQLGKKFKFTINFE